jgi:hypothetical protein
MSGSKLGLGSIARQAEPVGRGRLAWPAAVAVISALSVGGWVLVFKLVSNLVGV